MEKTQKKIEYTPTPAATNNDIVHVSVPRALATSSVVPETLLSGTISRAVADPVVQGLLSSY